jgi:GT2 family glycosyltransferase
MISIIILNYNRKDDVLYTIKNIILTNSNYIRYEIIVVDQNSSDGSPEAIRKSFPEVSLFCSEINLGVGGGRNRGAELAKGEILLFIDDDAHFETLNALNKIEKIFHDDLNLGIVGFRILNSNGQIRDWVYNSLNLKNSQKAFYTQQFVGCGHAIRADLFKKVNGYSDILFFWGEEIEFCLKTYRDTDFKIIYLPEIEIVHRVSQISRYHWKTSRTEFKSRNRFVLLLTYFPRNSICFYLFFLYFFLGYFIRALQNMAILYFLKGFFSSFKMNLKEEKLSTSKINSYSICYLKQFIGHPEFYNNLISNNHLD